MNAVTLALNDPGAAAANMFGAAPSIADVEVSDDGQNFRKLVDIPNDGGVEHTVVFPATTARFFRVAFTDKPASGFGDMTLDVENPFGDFNGMKPNPNFEISELVLHPGARVSRFEEKAGFANLMPTLSSSNQFPIRCHNVPRWSAWSARLSSEVDDELHSATCATLPYRMCFDSLSRV